jgi:hypothetical protein
MIFAMTILIEAADISWPSGPESGSGVQWMNLPAGIDGLDVR